jgi:hypothetical protein
MFRRALVPLLVVGLVNLSVPAFAAPPAANETSPAASAAPVTTPVPALSLAEQASRHVETLDRSSAMEARALAFAEQGGGAVDSRGHWCVAGMALLAGGIVGAAIAYAQRDPNPQKPSPPVGFVLGIGAATVGGFQVVRSCRR